MAETLYNATAELVRDGGDARVIRVLPDQPKGRHLAGQYGSLGMPSEVHPGRLIKRPYSLSCSMINLETRQLIDAQETPYYEFYFNRVTPRLAGPESLTPKLFRLRSGDRIFCGRKITGYYTLQDVPAGRHLLFISTLTGESANNALIAQALREGRWGRISHLLVGTNGWRSLYEAEHDALMRAMPTYRCRTLRVETYAAVEARLAEGLRDAARAEDELGFALDPARSHVFLCGDPALIGAPAKQGAWRYVTPTHGAIPILTAGGFSLRTRFKLGTIEYETYW